MTNSNKYIIALIIILRVFAALSMFFWPVLGFVFVLTIDFLDGYILKHRCGFSPEQYHRIDKPLDWFDYVVMLIIGLRIEFSSMLIIFFIFRLVGQLFYMRSKNPRYFILFPNLFEVVYLWIVVLKNYSITLTISIVIFRLLEELYIHEVLPNYLRKKGEYPKFMHRLGYNDKF
ncbi:MAG TPA: hypothetical protein PLS49_07335 [Candidatus Woesebacteria bacterium]|nr:hypothetical protein [Candidatus Woesebacteria bacterium]